MTSRPSIPRPALPSVFLLLLMATAAWSDGLSTPTVDPPATYTNPVGDEPLLMGDPFAYWHDGSYYLIGTTSPNEGFKCYTSKDLLHWQLKGWVWRKPAESWVDIALWAPEVKFYRGKFYLTYSGRARNAQPDRLLMGLAVSDTPEGPFRDLHTPWFDFGYSTIDGHIFVDDDGTPYLFFSRNGSQDGYGFGINYAVELARDLSGPVGEPVKLIEASQPWERIRWAENRCNEGAFVLKHQGRYYMTYSANNTGASGYGVGYATADHPLGPWSKADENPILTSSLDIGVSSPGHNSIVQSPDGTELFIVYHSHVDPAQPTGARLVNIDRIQFTPDGRLRVHGPTRSPQPLPSGAGATPPGAASNAFQPAVLRSTDFRHWIDSFNATDNELTIQHIPNAGAWTWMERNVPLFDCPDPDLEQTYFFRWWTFRKHLRKTPDGFVITEFLPDVPWAGKLNTISCAAGHHFYEGRWIADATYLDDYARFWFRGGGEPRRYSFWVADALRARSLVTADPRLTSELLPDLIRNYEAWENDHRDPNGLYWQIDDRDGMEVSVGGSGYRATLNSYQYGDALAIAAIAELNRQPELATHFRARAEAIQRLVLENLWDPKAGFFKVAPRVDATLAPTASHQLSLADVRELHGYTPWYFGLPEPQQAVAWKHLMDPQGFFARFGPTTAEQRHPGFQVAYEGHECQWNGPSWPYATSLTLTALANLLNGPPQDVISRADYCTLLRNFALSHRRSLNDGTVLPWIDENLNPFTGDWISRTLIRQRGAEPIERGKDYNHSTFCDLVISGLVGLRPRADNTVEVNPLAPASWDYFCLDRIAYHDHVLTILWDRAGDRYHRGRGLRLLCDGRVIASSDTLGKLTAPLPPKPTP